MAERGYLTWLCGFIMGAAVASYARLRLKRPPSTDDAWHHDDGSEKRAPQ